MNKEDVKVFLNDLYLDADDKELDFIIEEFNSIYSSIQCLEKIDTSDVVGASWPFEQTSTYLREDIVDHTLSNEEALQNADQVQDGYVKYVKVV